MPSPVMVMGTAYRPPLVWLGLLWLMVMVLEPGGVTVPDGTVTLTPGGIVLAWKVTAVLNPPVGTTSTVN